MNDTATPNPAPEAAAAPAAAPVAPVAVPAPAAPAAPVVVQSSGDAALDVAHQFFATHGVAATDLAMTSAKAGDFSVLRAVLAEKGVPGSDAYVAIAEQAHARAKAAEQAAGAARDATVHKTMGGADNWSLVKDFIASKATPEELQQINAGLNAGGVTAQATAKYLKDVYEAGVGPLPGASAAPERALADPGAGRGAGAPATNALSPAQYRQALADLVKQYGSGSYNRPEFDELARRRAAYRG